MSLIHTFSGFLNELRQHGYTNADDDADYEGKTVLLVKDRLYVLDEDNFDEFQEEINALLDSDCHDLDSLSTYINHDEKHPHTVLGTIESPFLVVSGDRSYKQSSLSPDVRKLLRHFGLTDLRTTYNDMTHHEDEFERDEQVNFKTSLKDAVFYHGTTTTALYGLAKKGLLPQNMGRHKGNYARQNINHSDKVFITLNAEAALSHACNAAREKGTYMAVIALRVPDVSKLDLDYDVAMDYMKKDPRTQKLGYLRIRSSDFHRDLGIASLDKKLGHFAYLGRIPAAFISAVFIDKNGYYDFCRTSEWVGEYDHEEQYENQDHNFEHWSKMTLPASLAYLEETQREAEEGDGNDDSDDDNSDDDEWGNEDAEDEEE